MSSDEASSSDAESVALAVQPKSKEKGKSKVKSSAVITPHGRNESSMNEWAFKPPKGAVLADLDGDAEDFDWDAVEDNEDLELWIVRVPEGVKAKHLQGLKLDVPSSSKTARLGSLSRKHASYDVWSLGADQTDATGAEEIKNFTCMLPRKRKGGRIFPAPTITTRHIVLSAHPVEPSTDIPETQDMSWSTGQNPPRPSYPKEVLKHRFMPYGSLAPTKNDTASMDVDVPAESPKIKKTNKAEEESPSKAKRRKTEGGETKKSKKTKTASD